ncbi:hypothetical protein GQ457_16G023470 [Hibiscus cannabinus]
MGLESIVPCLPRETLEKIATVPPPRIGMGSDSLGWRWEDNRKFTTRSAYGALCGEGEINGAVYWRQIWKMSVPQRICMFFWLAFHGRLLTNEERVRRHLSVSIRCSICSTGPESIEHALRLCSKARRVWEILIPPSKLSLFDALSFEDWLLQGIRNVASIGTRDDLWSTRFAVTCWLIWKSCCAQILGGVDFNSEGLARHCRGAAVEYAAAHACRQVPRVSI